MIWKNTIATSDKVSALTLGDTDKTEFLTNK